MYTCTQVQDLGNAAVSLTEAELGAMTSAEFTNCLETLGGLTGWSTGQLETMRDKVFSVSLQDIFSLSSVGIINSIMIKVFSVSLKDIHQDGSKLCINCNKSVTSFVFT